MFKIRKIKFENHPILKNLELNFCNIDGKAMDTIIFAGANGTGKSTILNELYSIASYQVKYPIKIEVENSEKIFEIKYFREKNSILNKIIMLAMDSEGKEYSVVSHEFKEKYSFSGIFSDVDINFNADNLKSVTSLNLDILNNSYRSTNDLPREINQLLIDVQALDDADIARAVKINKDLPYKEINVEERMSRFIKAFNVMFENLSYSHIENVDGHKEIVFKKYDSNVPIKNLSSGEKQVIYRGAFLLKDINAMNGAFIFIDEPEISLHPDWQLKIMNFYKGIFTSKNGQQTSQIFAVTHSPFIIHNDNRKNDKVIILERNNVGDIIVKDRPEYFKCNSIEVVKDAFSINYFNPNESIVYLEGRTDEKYFNKAAEVFEIDLPFKFKWIGYIDENGNECNTGYTSLNNAFNLLISQNLQYKNVCLYDCDTNKSDSEKNNIYSRCMPKYQNNKNMKKGIENALVLDDIDITSFYSEKIKEGDYGNNSTIIEFNKMCCCNHICSLENEKLKEVMVNLKSIIETILLPIFSENTQIKEVK